MPDKCLFYRATSHQRGHTCWFDTAVVTLANTESLHASTLGESKNKFKLMKAPTIGKYIQDHAGLFEYASKLHKKISIALSEDVCPLKPESGQDMLLFLESLLTYVGIPHLTMKAPSTSNTPIRIEGDPDTCGRIGTMDVDVFIEDKLGRAMNNYASKGGKYDNGILMVQIRGHDGGCLKIDCSPYLRVEIMDSIYELKLQTMTVSEHGHVMAFGKCRSDNEWVVFDNEFSGLGFEPRTFSGKSFESVKTQMYTFPHTYFSPKVGTVSLNPFFKEGIRSSTVFVHDFVKF